MSNSHKSILTGVNGADPFVLYEDGVYYMYLTTPGKIAGYKCHMSKDLKTWQDMGYCLTSDNSFGYKNFWAPEVVKHDGKYVMHYSAREKSSELLRIGVAVSDTPTGPFVDVGEGPLLSVEGKSTIDAHCFRDDDGKNYLFFSMDCPTNIINGVHTSQTMCMLLNDDLTKVIGDYKLLITPDCKWETTQNKEWQWNEGPFVLKHKGKYVMTYSANYYASKSYAVGVAVSDHPEGPYVKYEGNPILSYIEGVVSGPGHNAFFTDLEGKLKCVYHIHTDYNNPAGDRTACIADAGFDESDNLFIDYKQIV